MAEKELLEYLMLRHVNVNPRPVDPKQVPPKIYKSWKKRWVVLSTEVSPAHCLLHYCKTEGDWLLKSSSLVRCPLDDFKLERVQTKGFDNVLQLNFPDYSLEMAFDSLTKMDQWYNALQPIIDRYHVDLVRCPQYPSREGEYIMECLQDSFKLWTTLPKPQTALCWEWELKYLRRVHFHRHVSKLEVEAGRNTETGEGSFYFTGWHIKRLFDTMKEMMTTGAKVFQPTRPTNGYVSRGPPKGTTNSCPQLPQRNPPRSLPNADSDSEGDSTSTDSGHSSTFNFSAGSTQTSRSLPASTLLSSPPPIPPREPIQRRVSAHARFRPHYTDLNVTKKVSEDYVTIRRQPGYYVKDPQNPAEFYDHYEGEIGEASSSDDEGEQRYLEDSSLSRTSPSPAANTSHYNVPTQARAANTSHYNVPMQVRAANTSHYNVPTRARAFRLPPIPPTRNTSLTSASPQIL